MATPRVSLTSARYVVRRYALVLQAAFLVVAAASGGYWVNLLTEHKGDFGALGWANGFLVISLLALIAQLTLVRTEVRFTRLDAEEAVRDLLEVAARAVAFPLNWNSIQLRAHCYKYDSSGDCLQPVSHCSSHEHADNWTPIPCDSRHEGRFVIVKALRQKQDLNEEFYERDALEREVGVWDNLHTVLAAPIRVGGDETRVIGIVNFDSSLYEGEIQFSKNEAHDIAVIAARAVARLWKSDYTTSSAR